MDKISSSYNPMTRKEAMPLVLVIFAIICALPATVVPPPSAIAQEDDDEEENLASGTVSNVLDNVNSAGDNTNTQLSVPLIDQGQTDANLGLSEALDVTVERTLSTPPPPDDDELPPEDEAVFCLEDIDFGILCFNTLEECEFVEELFSGFIVSECEEFETPPSDAQICRVVDEEFNLGDCVPVQP
jgi:hypothetical protein